MKFILVAIELSFNDNSTLQKIIDATKPKRKKEVRESEMTSSWWKDIHSKSKCLFLFELMVDQDNEDVSVNIQTINEEFAAGTTKLLPDYQPLQESNKPILVEMSSGLRPYEMKLSSIVSMSTRIADPGGAQTLLDDYQMVFEQLAPITGLRGWLFGSVVNLQEEVVGIGLWDDEESLNSSIPPKSGYLISSYRRFK